MCNFCQVDNNVIPGHSLIGTEPDNTLTFISFLKVVRNVCRRILLSSISWKLPRRKPLNTDDSWNDSTRVHHTNTYWQIIVTLNYPARVWTKNLKFGADIDTLPTCIYTNDEWTLTLHRPKHRGVLTVIWQKKWSPVFFRNMLNIGWLIPRLSSGLRGNECVAGFQCGQQRGVKMKASSRTFTSSPSHPSSFLHRLYKNPRNLMCVYSQHPRCQELLSFSCFSGFVYTRQMKVLTVSQRSFPSFFLFCFSVSLRYS